MIAFAAALKQREGGAPAAGAFPIRPRWELGSDPIS
jgi:hypothetical protein